MDKISLEEIFKKYSFWVDDYAELKELSLELSQKVLELAAEKAYVEYEDLETGEIFDYTDVITDDGIGANINKQSILNVINLIE